MFRGHKSRDHFHFYFEKRTNAALKVQKMVRGWLTRRKFMKDLRDLLTITNDTDLLLSTEEIRKRNNAQFIFYYMHKFWKTKKRNRERLAAALRIQAYYRGRFIRHSSFVEKLKLGEYPRIYFLKEQKPQFVKILKSQEELFQQNDMTLEDALDRITEDKRFETIRLEEPDLFEWKPLPLLQFIMPTLGKKTIIRENKSLNLDKVPNESLTLKNFLFSPKEEREDTAIKLNKLKKRKCHIKIQTLRAQIQQRKKKSFLNQMIFYDKYNDFFVFEAPSVRIILSLLYKILDYNRDLDPQEDQ